MLYNKAAVKNREPFDNEVIDLVRRYHPFRLDDSIKDDVLKKFRTKKELSRERFEDITKKVAQYLGADFHHEFEGIRSTTQVWEDRIGHCIELANFLYAVYRAHKITTKILIAKNPRDYGCASGDEYGLHPFFVLKDEVKEKDELYVGDVDTGEVIPFKREGLAIATEWFSPLEFTAFYFQDAAEDLGINHGRFDEALEKLDLAQRIDKHNYTIHITRGDILYTMGSYRLAKKSYKRAIRMAPRLLDPVIAYADFLFDSYEDQELGVNVIRKALKKQKWTADVHLLRVLRDKLLRLDENSLAEQIEDMRKIGLKDSLLKGFFD